MVKALVLDVDGVLVGEKIGVNSPNPSVPVMERLKHISASGIPVVLCTGKPHYSISSIIEGANLQYPHITNGGSVVINPLSHETLASYPIDRDIVLNILKALKTSDIYTELYTESNYYLANHQERSLTDVHAHVLQRKPILVKALENIAMKDPVVKIMPIVPDQDNIPKVDQILQQFSEKISVAWGLHPIANPHQFCGITRTGISKRQTTIDVLSSLQISPDETLGVGDSTSDWKFMELCGYVAAMENAQIDLIARVRSRGEFGAIGGHVDDNGVLSVFDQFLLPTNDTHP